MLYWVGHKNQNITHITQGAAECDMEVVFWQMSPAFRAHKFNYNLYYTSCSGVGYAGDISDCAVWRRTLRAVASES